MKKVILLSLALVMALGALGIGYAAWTDTIAFSGTVTTGDVDIDLTGDYSGTYVFKNLADDSKVVVRKINNIYYYFNPETGVLGDVATPTDQWLLVASAQASAGTAQDTVVVAFENIYPCTDYIADFKVKVNGSIPVKIKILPVGSLDITDGFYTPGAGEVDLDDYLYNGKSVFQFWYYNPTTGQYISDLEGVQFEHNAEFVVGVTIHLPQDNALMNLNGSIAGRIVAVQWDKYDEEIVDNWDLSTPTEPIN